VVTSSRTAVVDRKDARHVEDLAELCVLVIEDDPDIQFLLSLLFGQAGATVLTAGSAEAAIDLIPTLRPDLVLVDGRLGSGMSGSDLIEKMRALPDTASTAIVAVTGAEQLGPAADHLVDAHIRKPFNPATIVTDSMIALDRRRSRLGNDHQPNM
jgi:CheY-like chemotaxis protein